MGASEYPPFDLLVIVDGLALAQTGEYRMRVRAKGWIESGELDTAGNALQRIFRPVVGHDAASTLRTRNRLGPFSPRATLDRRKSEADSAAAPAAESRSPLSCHRRCPARRTSKSADAGLLGSCRGKRVRWTRQQIATEAVRVGPRNRRSLGPP